MLPRAGRTARCQCAAPQRRAGFFVQSTTRRVCGSTASPRRVPSPAAPPPATALLLIDFQQGFITGEWADQQGGADQVVPIATAAARLAELFDSDTLAAVPAVATRFSFSGPDALPPANLDPAFSSIPWLPKASSNIMESEGFAPWLEARLSEGVTTLVVRRQPNTAVSALPAATLAASAPTLGCWI